MSRSGDGHTVHLNPYSSRAVLLEHLRRAAPRDFELRDLLLTVLDALFGHLSFTGGSFAILDGEDLVLRAAAGPFEAEALGNRVNAGRSRAWAAVRDGKPFLVSDLTATEYRSTSPRLRSFLAAPIVRDDRPFGWLEVDSVRANAFSDADAALLAAVADVVSADAWRLREPPA